MTQGAAIDTDEIPSARAAGFVSESDWIPKFWSFLLELEPTDIVSELIQNDLDQGATRTAITFFEDRLECEGNGSSVDEEGWKRLRMIIGAGDRVKAKRGKIGVKNHGLKTAFTIGDQLEVLSDGKSIVQTLYVHGLQEPPYPGASDYPVVHPHAPTEGCRVVVSYRQQNLRPRQGEAMDLPPIGEGDIDELFLASCRDVPELFMGIVVPEVAPRYEIVLRHWRLGEAVFRFSCTRPRVLPTGIELYRRACVVGGDVVDLPEGLAEGVARRFATPHGSLKERLPDFFRRKRRYFVEVAWRLDKSGRPLPAVGRYRYPIGFPSQSEAARTGHGGFYSAPFVCNTERHEPMWNEPTSPQLRDECEALFVEVFSRHLLRRWGPSALRALIPASDASEADHPSRSILAALTERGTMPTVDWKAAVRALNRGDDSACGPPSRSTGAHHVPPTYRFVVPTFKWDRQSLSTCLAIACPAHEMQLSPQCPREIVGLLADGHTRGFEESHVTFDENDALARLVGHGNKYFPAVEDLEREMANPRRAAAYLDVVLSTRQKRDSQLPEDQMRGVLLLPDTQGSAVPFAQLRSAASLPLDIPGLQLPPLLHPDLVGHPLLRGEWACPPYKMKDFLADGSLREASEQTRGRFWDWMRRNEGLISPRDRTALLGLAIWPDRQRVLHEFRELCAPRSSGVAKVLDGYLCVPHREVTKSELAMRVRTGPTSLREAPTHEELEAWLRDRLDEFPIGAPAAAARRLALRRFEAAITLLCRETDLAKVDEDLLEAMPAIAGDGVVRLRSELVVNGPEVRLMALPARFLLDDGPDARFVQRLCPAKSAATAEMVLAAFEEDSANTATLQPRLRRILQISTPGDSWRERLAALPIIQAGGQLRAPADLAFFSARGREYWGDWKVRISAKGLSQDDQNRFRDAGVTLATPNAHTSRAFFSWLGRQEPEVIGSHVACVLRHLRHDSGPVSWADHYPEISAVPTESMTGVRLVPAGSLQKEHVYLPDVVDLPARILEMDPGVLMAIASAAEVREPVTQELRELGVPSLRDALGDPVRVDGSGPEVATPAQLLACIRLLKSRSLQNSLLKRLDMLGVDKTLVRPQWRDRVERIEAVRIADRVEATYKFRRKRYSTPVPAGLDLESHVFWLADGRPDLEAALYEAIAAQCVFKPGALPFQLFSLQHAVQAGLQEQSYGAPTPWQEEEVEHEETQTEDTGETADATVGHSPFRPDPLRNLPSPGSIPSDSPGQTSTTGAGGDRSRRGGSTTRRTPPPKPAPAQELKHVEILKRDHYASHCQMCLSERTPAQLAPHGSYVEWEELRRPIMEAHHVDLKSGDGARHAGNLIVLCKLHHNNYGRRLSREAVLVALRDAPLKRTVTFHVGDSRATIDGLVATVTIRDTGEQVSLFFTKGHAEYWLEHSPVETGTESRE